MTAALTALNGVAAALVSVARLPDGPGTATVTWTGATGLHPTIKSVAGTIGHKRLAATGSVPDYLDHQGLTTSSSSTMMTLATIRGKLGGNPFTIAITLSTNPGSDGTSGFAGVTGTFHGLPVSATINPPANHAASGTELGSFSGTIGPQHVRGTIEQPKRSHGYNTAHATFVVSG